MLEIYHSVVYFAPERPKHYQALGLQGGWMAYFATRSGPLGMVPPAVVTACFYNFKHTMVARALPDAWLYTSPELAIQARLAVFDEAIHRLQGDGVTERGLREAADIAVAAVERCGYAGRPLFAAHAALPLPTEPHLALFWASSALREFRGDGHVSALAAAEVDGCEAHVLMAALGLVPAEQRRFRGWTDEDWDERVQRLTARGWITSEGKLTPPGRRARAAIERVTDTMAEEPWRPSRETATTRLIELLTPIASRIITGGDVPYPNGMGVPPVPELGASR
ncbi:MAG: hypothetical protein H0X12_13910 [Nocardioides sp.]|nr:hypothetical protein [Nocardioides sp.]